MPFGGALSAFVAPPSLGRSVHRPEAAVSDPGGDPWRLGGGG